MITNRTTKQNRRLVLVSVLVASWNASLTSSSSFVPNHRRAIDNHHATSVPRHRHPTTTTTLQRKKRTSPPSPTTTAGGFESKKSPVTTTWQSQSDAAEKELTSKTTDGMNPLTKASWYAVEAFGQLFGNNNNNNNSSSTTNIIDLSKKPSSTTEALRRIAMDNERCYFLSGLVDVEAYDEDCVFSDPFVSFSGRQRFVDNLANLGSFITEYDARMLKYDQDDGGTTVRTKLMVKLRLNLPWRPVLAWPWGVRYTIDPETFLITDHDESWDIAPWEGVTQIFRPGTLEIKKRDR